MGDSDVTNPRKCLMKKLSVPLFFKRLHILQGSHQRYDSDIKNEILNSKFQIKIVQKERTHKTNLRLHIVESKPRSARKTNTENRQIPSVAFNNAK